MFLIVISCFSQEIVKLPHDKHADIVWKNGEKNYYSDIWKTQVVTNVSVPSIQVFLPKIEISNGTAVIIAPGGGLFGLSINSEGNQAAKWLNEKGITAFVLKYRLVPTGEDGIKEISELESDDIRTRVEQILPLSISDGLAAVSYVRENAKKYGVKPNSIGFMGFSAGGAVTMGVTFNCTKENRPDFIVPVYPWMTVMGPYDIPKGAPPMLIVCASDDPLKLAQPSINLYSEWLKDNKSVGLHMYSKGGHGFGMRKQGLPSDNWIQRFYDWGIVEKIIIPSSSE